MQALACGVGALVVLREPRVPHPELARLAVCYIGAVGRHETYLLAWDHCAAGPRLAQLVLRSQHRVDPGLCGAIELPQHLAKRRFRSLLQCIRAWRGAEQQRSQR